jgi:hypothetical protein
MGQQFVVDSRSAASLLGAEPRRSGADIHLPQRGSFAISAGYKSLPYDPVRDFDAKIGRLHRSRWRW